MRAFPYLRVSGKTQVDGDGPERQSQKILSFCDQHGLETGATYFEAGVSGTTEALDRPMFAKLLELGAQQGDAIVVERLDRLARDLMVQEFLLLKCHEKGIKVFAADWEMVDLADNDADPTRKLMRQIIGAISEWERTIIVRKMKAGADKKRRETGRCGGVVTYGKLPGEHATLRWLLAAHRNGEPLSSIAGAANKMGYRTRSGKEWTKQRVHNAIARHAGAKL